MTLFVYDKAGHVIGEYDASGGPKKEHVWFNGEPVAVLDGTDAYYVHTDHLGTPRVVSDADTAIWRWESDPFGSDAAEEDPDEDLTGFTYNLRFPGQYYDAETDLHYNYFRTLDPSTGRYLESDPIGLQGGLNTYGYVHGNPLMYIDPYGLAEKYSGKLGGLIGFLVPGVGATGELGVVVPDDWSNLRCYQLFVGFSFESVIGVGAYAGLGATASSSTTDGPLPTFDGSTRRYDVAAVGYAVAYEADRTGTDEWEGGGFRDFVEWVWGEGRANDTPSGGSATVAPKFGGGYGAYAGIGYTTGVTAATPTFGSDCECQ